MNDLEGKYDKVTQELKSEDVEELKKRKKKEKEKELIKKKPLK
jgi:multicomponent Na+:H+ antiporter subunit G